MKTNRKSILFFCASMLLIWSSCKKTTVYETTNNNTDDSVAGTKHILITPWDNGIDKGLLEVLDSRGNVLHSKITDSLAYDLKEWDFNGNTYYTYGLHDPSAYTAAGVAYTPCTIVETDSNLVEIQRFNLISYNGINTANHHNSLDPHEFIMLSPTHYIAIAYYEKRMGNLPNTSDSATIIAPIIQEVNNGQVIFQWDGSTFPEFYNTSVESNEFSSTASQDYMHLNCVTIDPKDNNLICSFRNLDQVIKINRTTGGIIWRLGGTNSDFPISTDQQFLRQHFATLTDNNQTLILFDNGETTQRPYTRILEFQLNETAHTITGYKSFNIPMTFSYIMGSVQKHGDYYFIGGGSAGYVIDINYITGVKDFEMDLNKYNYRALMY